ncbi:Beta-galactosidase [Spironucleus salmonicida]|uniref:Beta-galactosidase n=1 Tax=Spironucleus salmonicida TaxID=348837 RepID=V6LYC6_9EUKA|nr:Beta-galactosidase [Spironucleus salmonicida]|eukprot:EST49580.1 Beta-galactosidase [Spironucleus salmonicida]
MLLTLAFFGWDKTEFTVNLEPFQIHAGAVDLIRIPYTHWEQRILAAKTMGLNTMVLQLNWNSFEKEDETFDFTSDQNNVNEFIRLCKSNDMKVILRPGPQSHTYTAFGGIPSRISFDNVSTRDLQNKEWVRSITSYIKAVSAVINENSEDVAMIQIDQLTGIDEISSDYLRYLRQLFLQNGVFGPFMLLESIYKFNSVEGMAIGLSGNPSADQIEEAKKISPNLPVFYGNHYTGDVTTYRSGPPQSRFVNLQPILKANQSFILFPFCGGSSFGFTASGIQSQVYDTYTTSNDFGAPLTENGYPTPQYNRLTRALTGSSQYKLKVLPMQTIDSFTMVKVGTLEGQNFINKGTFKDLPTFESQRQNEGLGIYEVQIPPNSSGNLALENVRDYAQVYIDGELVHTFNREINVGFNYMIKDTKSGRLQLVVDASTHQGFSGYAFEDDKKGVWGNNMFNSQKMHNFTLSLLDVENFKPVEKLTPTNFTGGLFKAKFSTLKVDTYIDLKDFKKGYVFINNVNIGRYQNVNKDQSNNFYSRIYCPSTYLNDGENILFVLDTLTVEESIQVSGVQLAFACQEGYAEVGAECIKVE